MTIESFKDYVTKPKNFCYMVYPTEESKAKIASVRDRIRKLSAGLDIGEEVPIERFHTTIRYCTLKPGQDETSMLQLKHLICFMKIHLF
jgi:hypothetical protein